MPRRSPPPQASHLPGSRPPILRLLLAGLAGAAAALLVSCGSSGQGLIPTGNAGPLQSDFEAVRQAAESGDGNCTATEAALAKTEEDFRALPATVNAGLRNNLRQGIANLRVRAHELCVQPLAGKTVTSTAPKTTTTTRTTATTPTVTQPPSTQSTPTTTTPTTSSPGGGTPAPSGEASPGAGNGQGGGVGAGEGGSGGAGAGGVGAGGAEGGK